MPLIIAVVAVIAIFVIVRDNAKDRARDAANYEKSSRKTNAEKERQILDSFLKRGESFDDAFVKTQEAMSDLGYDPCIPKNAYGTDFSGMKIVGQSDETSYIGNVSERFDSDFVKMRKRQLARNKSDLTEANIYRNFPKNIHEYNQCLRADTLQMQAVQVGETFTYPGYGTVEVIGHRYLNASTGFYDVKVLRTGEIVTTIKIGDDKIRQLNTMRD